MVNPHLLQCMQSHTQHTWFEGTNKVALATRTGAGKGAPMSSREAANVVLARKV
jgi:hypothetical protein